MPLIQSVSHLNQIKSELIRKSQQGRWYQPTSRTYIVKTDARFAALSLNCFQRLAAAFLKLLRIDYFAKVLKAKEVAILDKKAIHALLADNQQGALEQVLAKAVVAKKENKKLGLFLCRGAEQSVPSDPGETWITLDLSHHKPLDPARIHLQMDLNDKRLDRIQHLFDKVILDFSSWGVVADDEPWKKLRSLLKDMPEAQLITEINGKGASWKEYGSEEELQQNPIDYAACTRRGGFLVPWIPAWSEETLKIRQKEAVKIIKEKMEEYLRSLFHTVIVVRDKPFPCQPISCDYFVLRGPKK